MRTYSCFSFWKSSVIPGISRRIFVSFINGLFLQFLSQEPTCALLYGELAASSKGGRRRGSGWRTPCAGTAARLGPRRAGPLRAGPRGGSPRDGSTQGRVHPARAQRLLWGGRSRRGREAAAHRPRSSSRVVTRRLARGVLGAQVSCVDSGFAAPAPEQVSVGTAAPRVRPVLG